ncbi:MAG: hypothetical protein ACKO8I_02840 [Cyanobacteriota bacterium]
MPARLHSRSTLMVCADCGSALASISPSERRDGWLGMAALGGAVLLTTAMVMVSALSLESPTLAERQQEARLSDGGAAE